MMKPISLTLMMALGASLLLTGGCSPVGAAAGAGASLGIAATKEGGLSQSANDFGIRAQINDLWFRNSIEIFRKLNLTINDGRVLITGIVQNPEHRLEAVRLAWQPKGVKQVINEIRVAESDGVGGFVRDEWITAQLRTKMTLDKDVQSINYSIDTVQGTIYLMGVARTQAELNHVTAIARTIPNVRQVISYVKLAGEAVPLSSEGGGQEAPAFIDSGASVLDPLPSEGSATAPGPAAVEVQPLQ